MNAAKRLGRLRMSHMWSLARECSSAKPKLASHYVQQMSHISRQLEIGLPAEICDLICSHCSSLAIPGVDSTTRIRRRSRRSKSNRKPAAQRMRNQVVRSCKICQETKLFDGIPMGEYVRNIGRSQKRKQDRDQADATKAQVDQLQRGTKKLKALVKEKLDELNSAKSQPFSFLSKEKAPSSLSVINLDLLSSGKKRKKRLISAHIRGQEEGCGKGFPDQPEIQSSMTSLQSFLRNM